jgi:hypothetical protein
VAAILPITFDSTLTFGYSTVGTTAPYSLPAPHSLPGLTLASATAVRRVAHILALIPHAQPIAALSALLKATRCIAKITGECGNSAPPLAQGHGKWHGSASFTLWQSDLTPLNDSEMGHEHTAGYTRTAISNVMSISRTRNLPALMRARKANNAYRFATSGARTSPTAWYLSSNSSSSAWHQLVPSPWITKADTNV